LPRLPRLAPEEADAMLLKAGFRMVRSKGSHRIYMKATIRFVIPFHAGRTLHPKIVKRLLKVVEAAEQES